MIMMYTIFTIFGIGAAIIILGWIRTFQNNKRPEPKPESYFNATDLKDQLDETEIAVNLIYEDLLSMGYVVSRDSANLAAKERPLNVPSFEDFYTACTYCKVYDKEKLKEYYGNLYLHYKILILATKKYCLIPEDGKYNGKGDVKGDYRRESFVNTLLEIEKLKKIEKELSDL